MSIERGIMATINKVRIPKDVTVIKEGSRIKVTGPKGTLSRIMQYPSISITFNENDVVISTDSVKKELVALCGTFAAHIKNMCKGVTEGYSYKMKVVYSHFPIQLKMAGNKLEINNFLGEKNPRFARIESDVKVTLGNDELTIFGIDKQSVGTTASNIEHATKIRYRDPRVFQDGIYLVERA